MLADDHLYKHVKNQIVDTLSKGQWVPGEKLPSEARLAAQYGVGISTIRAALAELSAAGLVVRRQGKGTFVTQHDDQHSVYRFFHVVRNDGKKSFPVSQLVSLGKAAADDATADRLQLPRVRGRHEVFKIRNVLTIEGTPVVLSDIVIPADLFPGLDRNVIQEGGRTLYAVYQRHFGITIVRSTEELCSVHADAAVSRTFGIETGEPILQIRRMAYTFGNKPVELRTSRIDTRNYHYRIEEGDDI